MAVAVLHDEFTPYGGRGGVCAWGGGQIDSGTGANGGSGIVIVGYSI